MLHSGRVRSWYDRRITRELERTHTPATIFVTGLWVRTAHELPDDRHVGVFKTAPERVASALIDLALQFGRPARDRKRGAVTFHLYPTRGDLADWLGLTIETVSRAMTRLKRQGLIRLPATSKVALLVPVSGLARTVVLPRPSVV